LNLLLADGYEVSHSTETWKEEICSAAHRHELRQSRGAIARIIRLRLTVGVGERAPCNGLSIPEQRIALFSQAIELGIHNPRVLHELKLPEDIRDYADEIDSALSGICLLGNCLVGSEFWPLLTSMANHAMKPS